jgi:hypothetical protein
MRKSSPPSRALSWSKDRVELAHKVVATVLLLLAFIFNLQTWIGLVGGSLILVPLALLLKMTLFANVKVTDSSSHAAARVTTTRTLSHVG